MSDLVKIGALWKHEGKSERSPVLTGKLGDARLVIFANGHKKTDKHPDYILYVENQKKREEEVDVPPTVPDDSEIPF